MSLIFDLFRHEPRFASLQAGEYLFRENEPSKEKMYVLVSGMVDIIANGSAVEQATPGTIVGETGVIEPGEPRPISVLAITHCEFIEIDRKRFDFLISQSHSFAFDVMRSLAKHSRLVAQPSPQ